MFPAARPIWASVFLTAAATAALAQPAARDSDRQPAAAGVELTYRSTFDNYQRFTDEKVGSWRDANDNVGRIGGWRAYAKEARQPAGPSGTAPDTPAAPAADPHAGHGKQ